MTKIAIVLVCILLMLVLSTEGLPRFQESTTTASSPIKRIKRYLETATTQDYKNVERKEETRSKRHVLEQVYRWPNNLIPYHIWTQPGKGSFAPRGDSYKKIKKVMKDIEDVSCLRFNELTYEEVNNMAEQSYLKIFAAQDSECRTVSPGYGLGSAVFLKDIELNSSQDDDHCMSTRVILHEFFHVFGFLHEHQREDSHLYIKIFKENIKEEHKDEFLIQKEIRKSKNLGAYDRKSIMHYKNKEFSKNGQDTMAWKEDQTLDLGGDQLSKQDIIKLNTYYKCPNVPTLKPRPDQKELCLPSFCVGKADGFYPHQSNSHMYIKCTNHKTSCQPCFPTNFVFVKRCGICMANEAENCKVERNCPKDLCKGKSNGLFLHVHQKNIYVNCYFERNFGCYECPNDHEFDDLDKKCVWKPNMDLN